MTSLVSAPPSRPAGPVRRLLQLKFEVRSRLASAPAAAPLFRPYLWWAQYKMRGHIDPQECRVDRSTEFVLDGFQGSGNSFATVAFKSCQTTPVRLAHHLHAPAQIIQAVRWAIPTLVTLRAPADAVVSLVSRWPYLSLRQGLRAYVRFYDALLPHLDGVVVSPFPMTTRHLDEVFRAVNRRFDTSFGVFDHTREQVRRIRAKTFLPPEEEARRGAVKAALRAELDAGRCDAALREATRVYEDVARRALRPGAEQRSSRSAGPK
jgi:hypothetical protein